MLTYLYLNELKPIEPELFKYLNNQCKKKFPLYEKYKDLLILQYVDYYEINFVLKLSEKQEKNAEEFLKKLNISILKIKNILNNASNPNMDYKFLLLNDDEKEIYIKLKNNKIIEIYGKLIINKDFLKNLIELFDKIKIAVIETIEEEYIFNNNTNRNVFLKKEILYYMKIIDLYVGLTFYLIKNYLKEIFTFIHILKIEKITSKNIEIKNSFQKLFNKKTRINKKFHILNISNIETIQHLKLYKNIINNKYYFKILEENLEINIKYFYNIKSFYILNRKNIIKIKEKYNRSNEILLLYKDINDNKYIIKLTRSISKNLIDKLKEYNIDLFLKEIKENEKKEKN